MNTDTDTDTRNETIDVMIDRRKEITEAERDDALSRPPLKGPGDELVLRLPSGVSCRGGTYGAQIYGEWRLTHDTIQSARLSKFMYGPDECMPEDLLRWANRHCEAHLMGFWRYCPKGPSDINKAKLYDPGMWDGPPVPPEVRIALTESHSEIRYMGVARCRVDGGHVGNKTYFWELDGQSYAAPESLAYYIEQGCRPSSEAFLAFTKAVMKEHKGRS